MKKFLLIVLALVIAVILGVVGYITYLGFMPGLSNLVGTSKPKDLGVSYTKADYDGFMLKTATNYTELSGTPNPDKSIIFSGQKDAQLSFTNAQASARINYDQWAYMPFSNVQLKFNDDGTFEMSSNLVMSRVDGFIASIGGVGYSKADVEKGMGYLGLVKTDPAIYMKARVTVTNNQPSIALQNLEVGKIRVPIEKFDSDSFLVGLTKQVFARVPGFYVQSFTLSNDKADFKGTIPEKLEVQFAK